MSFPHYPILVQQKFRCQGVSNYVCPLGIRTFDIAGYHIVNKSIALCPSCFVVYTRRNLVNPTNPTNLTKCSQARIQAKQRIYHFLHIKNWTVGNEDYTLPFNAFWSEFYRWSESERMYTKKTLVRSVITELCGLSHDSTHLTIGPK